MRTVGHETPGLGVREHDTPVPFTPKSENPGPETLDTQPWDPMTNHTLSNLICFIYFISFD